MVDFAKMLEDMNKDKERRAALTPEQRAAEDNAEEQKRLENAKIVDDRETFGDRKLRTVDAAILDERRSNMRGDVMLYAKNGQGNFTVVVPGLRADHYHKEDAKIMDAQFAAGAREVPVKMTGFFKPRSWQNSEGKTVEAWDFVMAEGSFQANGKEQKIGYPVSAQPQKSQEPKPRKAKDQDER